MNGDFSAQLSSFLLLILASSPCSSRPPGCNSCSSPSFPFSQTPQEREKRVDLNMLFSCAPLWESLLVAYLKLHSAQEFDCVLWTFSQYNKAVPVRGPDRTFCTSQSRRTHQPRNRFDLSKSQCESALCTVHHPITT